MMNAKELGRFGEDVAAEYLESQGFDVLARNYHCSMGEVDLICRRGGTLVFVEVKTRRSVEYGSPAAAVDAGKLRHMSRVAAFYASTRNLTHMERRLDVMEVVLHHTEGVEACISTF